MSDVNTHSPTAETAPPKRIGFKRWIALGLIALGVFLHFVQQGIFKPVLPTVVLPAEPIFCIGGQLEGIHCSEGSFPFTNTYTALLLADVVLLIFIMIARGGAKNANDPKRWGWGYSFVEILTDFWWTNTQNAAGKWAKMIFPVILSIFWVVWVANMTKLMPFFETVGNLVTAHDGSGFAPVQLAGSLYVLNGSEKQAAPGHGTEATAGEHTTEATAGEHTTEATAGEHTTEATAGEHTTEATAGEHAAEVTKGEHAGVCTQGCEILPWFRGLATDLNFTLVLAVFAVIFVQVVGVRALGIGYFSKFVNIPALLAPNPMEKINFAVGLLEIVSEVSKILSFAFRLFGNIFAGTLLLAVIGWLVPVALPAGLMLLETFFGSIQAYVFAMLVLVFASQATISHHADEHH